jgi:hypothetical protein
MHQQQRVSPIMLLLARFACPDLRRMPDHALHAHFLHQLQKPLHRTGGFDAHPHRTWQPGIKLAYLITFVRKNTFFHFARFHVEHRQRLLSRM